MRSWQTRYHFGSWSKALLLVGAVYVVVGAAYGAVNLLFG